LQLRAIEQPIDVMHQLPGKGNNIGVVIQCGKVFAVT